LLTINYFANKISKNVKILLSLLFSTIKKREIHSQQILPTKGQIKGDKQYNLFQKTDTFCILLYSIYRLGNLYEQ